MILFGGEPDEDNQGECFCCVTINIVLYFTCSLSRCNHGPGIGYMKIESNGQTVHDGSMGDFSLKFGPTASITCGYHEGRGHSCNFAVYDMFIRNENNQKILKIGTVNLNNGDKDIEVGPFSYQVTKSQMKTLL